MKTSVDGNTFLECSRTKVKEPFEMVNVVKKVTEEAEETSERTPQSKTVELNPILHSGVDYCLSGKLASGCKKQSIAIDNMSQL